MIPKTLYKVTITLQCGDTVVFDDEQTEGIGTSAYQQMRGDILVREGTKETYIPAHCVCKVEVEKTETEVPYEDETCKE